MFTELLSREQEIIALHFKEDLIIAEDYDNQAYLRSKSDLDYSLRDGAVHAAIKVGYTVWEFMMIDRLRENGITRKGMLSRQTMLGEAK